MSPGTAAMRDDDLGRRNRRVAGVLLAIMGMLAAAALLWGIRW
jgi:hypothetical protein